MTSLRDTLLHLGQVGVVALSIWLGSLLSDNLKWDPLLADATIAVVILVLTQALINLVLSRPTVNIQFNIIGSTIPVARININSSSWNRNSEIHELIVTARTHSLLGRYVVQGALRRNLVFMMQVQNAPIRCVVEYSPPDDEPDLRRKQVREDPRGVLRITPIGRPPRDTWVFARVSLASTQAITDHAFSTSFRLEVSQKLPLKLERLIKVRSTCSTVVIHR